MNRKGFLEVCAGLLACVSLLAGCGNLSAVNGTVSGGENGNTLSISLNTNADGTFARTIEPDVLTTADVNYYEIEGTASTGEVIQPTELIVTSGKATLNLAPAVWSLTLHAYDSKTDKKELLRSYASVDMRKGGAPVIFTLTSTDVTTDGGVNLTCTYTGAFTPVKTARISLYDTQTGKPVMTHETTPASVEVVLTEEQTATIAGAGFTYTKSTIAPGTYNFAVTFLNADGDEIGYYSDYVLIEPGRTTEKTITIKDVIATVPVAPGSFTAKMVNGSGNNGYYNVRFDWKDESTNETYFRILVKEYTSIADAAPVVYTTFDNTFFQTPSCVSGSLFAGNTTCTVRLPAGRLFDAEIYAVNKAGTSDVCSREISTSDTDYTGYAAPDAGKINCVQLSYNLNGGTLKTDENTTYPGTTLVEYAVYTGSAISLKKINATVTTGQEYPTLIYKSGNSSYDFQYWVDNADGVSQKTETDGFKNIYVKACYNSGSVAIGSLKELEDSRVKATYCEAAATANLESDTDCKNKSVEAAAAQKITLAVKAPGATDTIFTQYRFILNNVIMAETAADNTADAYTTYTIETIKMESGTYNVTVAGYNEETKKWYSNTFTIAVNR